MAALQGSISSSQKIAFSSSKPPIEVDLVRSYLRDIGRVPLLSHEQEITLGRQVQELMSLEGVDEEMAAAIIKHRENNGAIQSEEELSAVEGLDLDTLLSQVRFSPAERTFKVKSKVWLIDASPDINSQLNIIANKNENFQFPYLSGVFIHFDQEYCRASLGFKSYKEIYGHW